MNGESLTSQSEQAEVKVVGEKHQRLRYPLGSEETNMGILGYTGVSGSIICTRQTRLWGHTPRHVYRTTMTHYSPPHATIPVEARICTLLLSFFLFRFLSSLPTPFYSVLVSIFFLYGPFNCISFHKFSRQVSVFSLCSSGWSYFSALLVLSAIYLFMKDSFSPDIIPCGEWACS